MCGRAVTGRLRAAPCALLSMYKPEFHDVFHAKTVFLHRINTTRAVRSMPLVLGSEIGYQRIESKNPGRGQDVRW